MKLVQWVILSFMHKTPPTLFFLHFGETSFRWARVENAWAPPKIFLSLPPYQTTTFLIFFPIFSPNFSILPKIHPSKHSVNVREFELPIAKKMSEEEEEEEFSSVLKKMSENFCLNNSMAIKEFHKE